jgi:hypothetical protein
MEIFKKAVNINPVIKILLSQHHPDRNIKKTTDVRYTVFNTQRTAYNESSDECYFWEKLVIQLY